MRTPGIRGTQRDLLDLIKRRGHSTIPDLAAEVGLNIETIRQHLKTLVAAVLGFVSAIVRSVTWSARPESPA